MRAVLYLRGSRGLNSGLAVNSLGKIFATLTQRQVQMQIYFHPRITYLTFLHLYVGKNENTRQNPVAVKWNVPLDLRLSKQEASIDSYTRGGGGRKDA